MKMTVGLMTLHRVNNFGSVLQTYATIKLIRQLGYSCTLIDYIYPDLTHLKNALGNENRSIVQKEGWKGIVKSFLKKLHLLDFAKRVKFDILIFKYRNQIWTTGNEDEFVSFREKFLKPYSTHGYYKRKDILKTPPLFDVYVTGSDQTWNPRYLADDYSFLLDFAPKDRKKIAFSASFGASRLLPQYIDSYRRLLSEYSAISVRESSGIGIVGELTGQEAEWVLDSTLILNKQEWMKLADDTRSPKEKFIFCYMMDYVFDPFPILFPLLQKLKKALPECRVCIWCDKAHYADVAAHGYEVFDKMRPEEFLAMYEKASYIVTNSFHGTAFSVNFGKDFTVILNPDQSTKDSRGAEVLNLFGLQNRGIKTCDEFDCSPENLKVDYSLADVRLAEAREKSLNFLKKVFAEDGEKNEYL